MDNNLGDVKETKIEAIKELMERVKSRMEYDGVREDENMTIKERNETYRKYFRAEYLATYGKSLKELLGTYSEPDCLSSITPDKRPGEISQELYISTDNGEILLGGFKDPNMVSDGEYSMMHREIKFSEEESEWATIYHTKSIRNKSNITMLVTDDGEVEMFEGDFNEYDKPNKSGIRVKLTGKCGDFVRSSWDSKLRKSVDGKQIMEKSEGKVVYTIDYLEDVLDAYVNSGEQEQEIVNFAKRALASICKYRELLESVSKSYRKSRTEMDMDKKDEEIGELKKMIEDMKKQLESKDLTIKEQQETIDEQTETIEEQKETIDEQGKTIKSQEEIVNRQNGKIAEFDRFVHEKLRAGRFVTSRDTNNVIKKSEELMNDVPNTGSNGDR